MPKNSTKPAKTYTKVTDYDRVKWTDANGVVHYGTVQSYGSNMRADESRFARGILRVNDAVLLVYNDVPINEVTPIEFGSNFKDDEYDKYVDAELKKAQRLSDSVGNGVRVGKLFSVGVADGAAWYVVTKVTERNATVSWRSFCPDHYKDQVLGCGGTFPKRVIESLCRRASRMMIS